MIIAISGQSGCGNTTVTDLLEQAHGLRKINFTLRNLASEKNVSFHELCARAAIDPSLDLELDHKIIELLNETKENQVVGSRLAIWFDDPRITTKLGITSVELPRIDLKVWLYASFEVRAARTHAIKPKEPPEYTQKRDAEDRQRYLRAYGIDVLEHSQANLVIDTEKFNAKDVVALIAEAAKRVKQ